MLGDRLERAMIDANSRRVAEMRIAGEEESHDIPI
jgi:hypothetical protein